MSKIIKVSNNRTVRNTFKNNILLAKEVLSTNNIYGRVPKWILVFTDIKDSGYDDGDGYYEEDLMVANAISNWLGDWLEQNRRKHTNWRKLRKLFPFYKCVEITRCDTFEPNDIDKFYEEDIKPAGRNIYYAEFEYETNGRLYINTWVKHEEIKEKEDE